MLLFVLIYLLAWQAHKSLTCRWLAYRIPWPHVAIDFNFVRHYADCECANVQTQPAVSAAALAVRVRRHY